MFSLAGDGSEAQSNRQSNFQNTVRKLSVADTFAQKVAVPNKRLTAEIKPEDSMHTDSISSLDSTPNIDVGKSNVY